MWVVTVDGCVCRRPWSWGGRGPSRTGRPPASPASRFAGVLQIETYRSLTLEILTLYTHTVIHFTCSFWVPHLGMGSLKLSDGMSFSLPITFILASLLSLSREGIASILHLAVHPPHSHISSPPPPPPHCRSCTKTLIKVGSMTSTKLRNFAHE